MTKREWQERAQMYAALQSLGFTYNECERLRRISMTLRRWHELECGTSNDFASWLVERDEISGKPYRVTHHHNRAMGNDVTRSMIPDREKGAQKRLQYIVHSRNCRVTPGSNGQTAADVSAYIQGDPRGAALYILRPGDVPKGGDAGSYYTRGICVY